MRPCETSWFGQKEDGVFLGWGVSVSDSGTNETAAIVERKDGSVDLVDVTKITFKNPSL